MKSLSLQTHYRNCLLASLNTTESKGLQPHLVPMVFKRSQILHNAGESVKTVYFLEDGVCSIVSTMEDGNNIEVGIIGRDGFVGIPAILGTDHSLNQCLIQLPGSGYSVSAKVLEELCIDPSSELRRGMLRAVHGLLAQTGQTAACNRVHQIEERLSRWLLMCHDRTQNDSLPITHEFLAVMLGTRRSTVTVAAGMLQKAGLIEYGRGNVRIVDLKGLKGAACECYLTVYDEYVRLGLL